MSDLTHLVNGIRALATGIDQATTKTLTDTLDQIKTDLDDLADLLHQASTRATTIQTTTAALSQSLSLSQSQSQSQNKGSTTPPPNPTPAPIPTPALPTALEPYLQQGGAEIGEDPTEDTIRHGTVRMEEHPDYPTQIATIHAHGFTVTTTDTPTLANRIVGGTEPSVVLAQILAPDHTTVIATERTVRLMPHMRYLDLEHEIDHLHQLTDTHRFPQGPPWTHILVQRDNGNLKLLEHSETAINKWQNVAFEYHVRLQEILRLNERDVPESVLADHVAELEEWKDRHRQVSVSPRRRHWQSRHFPEIGVLESQVEKIWTIR